MCRIFLCSLDSGTYYLDFPYVQSVQLLSCVRLFATPWITAHQASLSITNYRSSLRLTSMKSVMPSNHLILCRPLLLPAPNPSQHQSLFQWVNSPHQVAKVLEFQLQHHSVWRNSKADLFQNGLIGSPESPDQVKNLTLVRGQVGLGNEWNCQELRWMGPCEKGCCYSVPVNYHPQKH